jgi:hypothetical protein
MRVQFLKKGRQGAFLDFVATKLNVSSIRGILQFGFNVPYSTLKNYHNESRLLPESLFLDMCKVAKIDRSKLRFKLIEENWGKIKGGKRGK